MESCSNAPSRSVAATASIRREMIVRPPGTETERDLSWQDWTTPWIMSDDGERIVFEEGNDVRREGYAIFVRQTDGSPPLKMGYGAAIALSPDDKWLAIVRRPFGDDGDFQQQRFTDLVNNDLANTIGNLLNRTSSMARRCMSTRIRARVNTRTGGR